VNSNQGKGYIMRWKKKRREKRTKEKRNAERSEG
jgi:hypothetical protein